MASLYQLLAVTILTQAIPALCLHVLVVPLNINSHIITFGRTAELLLKKGHNVTFVVSNTQFIPQSVKDIPMNIEYYRMNKVPILQTAKYREKAMDNALNGNILTSYALLSEEYEEFYSDCEDMLSDDDLHLRLKREKFDIAIGGVFTCQHVLTYRLNIPFTILGSECFSMVLRIPAPPSYLPRNFHPLPFTEKMGFGQRFVNFMVFILDHYLLEDGDDLIKKHVPDKETISYLTLYQQSRLCFKIKPIILDFARPITPNVISVGNLMARPAKALPTDLFDFVSGAKHGVIVMCFGSWMTYLPYVTALKFFDAFSQLKQRVIWKYHGKVPDNVTDNIKIMSWLPQNDLLGHGNTKLFIYHGGFAGTLEAVYHGVPMIIMPLFLDQTSNAVVIEDKLYGRHMSIASFTSRELVNTIKQVIGNNSYRTSLKAAGEILRDPVELPDDTLDYWLKHVVKYGDKHLRVHGLEMPLYQYYSLDVILVLTSLILVSVVVVYRLFMLCCRFICKRKASKIKDD